MSEASHPLEPYRQVDLARLDLTRLRIEDGVSLNTMFQHITETAAETLSVERAGIWLLVDEDRSLRCADLYERSKKEHSSGVTIQVSDFPDYFDVLRRRKTLPAEVALTDSRTNSLAEAYLIPLGITSMLDAPIFVAGEMIGVVCHEHIGPPREWSSEERDFAGSIADIVSIKIRAAEMEEARIALRTQAIQIAETRRMDALAALAAGTAHDFNNFLTVILAMSELIASNPDVPNEVADQAKLIHDAGVRGATLVKELMSFGKPGPAHSRVIQPADVISSQLAMLQMAADKRHKIHLQINAPHGRVLLAQDQLERALLNLIVNARDAMPDGGPIDVMVDEVQDCDEDGQPGRFLQIAVSDRGSGIPQSVLSKIFDPFFTTKSRGHGTGLGLAMVKQIVSHSGGFIRVDTAEGKGSTFRLYFPRVRS